jgi:NDP-sugar pyrophosphorylase family protein
VRDYVVDDEVFLTTYGDTVTDAPLPLLIAARAANGKVASLLSYSRTTPSTRSPPTNEAS